MHVVKKCLAALVASRFFLNITWSSSFLSCHRITMS
ncbi:unnamed protein product, partial [Amoebophrya sp. A25]|eukprot:GSA25T00022021001.1